MPYQLLPESPKASLSGKEITDTAFRLPVQAALGAGAVLPGMFGDIASGLHEYVTGPAGEALGFGKKQSYEETPIGKLLPTTATHRQRLEEGMPSLKPKNRIEKFVKDFSEDAASLFTPGRVFRMGRYAFSPIRSMGSAIAANTLGEATYQFSGDESKADKVRHGSMLAFSLFNPTSARNIYQNLYQQANQILPQTAVQNATYLTNGLNQLQNRILQGRPPGNVAASEQFVLNQVDNFRNLIQNNQINMRSLVAQRRSFNEELQRNLYNIPNRDERARARALAEQISGITRQVEREYGVTNPQWWQHQSEADRAFGAIQHSNFISRTLEHFMRGRPEALAHLFGIGIPTGIAAFNAPASVLGATVYQTAKLADRIYRSPALRTHYARVVGAAAADNPKLIDKELDAFESKIKKEKTKQKYILLPEK